MPKVREVMALDKIKIQFSKKGLTEVQKGHGNVIGLMTPNVAASILRAEYWRIKPEEEALEIIIDKDDNAYVRKVTALAKIEGAFGFSGKNPQTTENLISAIHNVVDGYEIDDAVKLAKQEGAEKLTITIAENKRFFTID